VNTEKLKELNFLFFELITQYHQKLGAVFHLDDQAEPRCNKNQKKAMFIIDRAGRMTATDLGKCLDLQKGSLTTLVDSLEKLRLLRREPDRQDRRKVWLYLTAAGNDYLRSKLQLYHQQFSQKFARIHPGEVEILIQQVRQVVKFMREL
jgi:DNA-binding MarR family transcriptional regulator